MPEVEPGPIFARKRTLLDAAIGTRLIAAGLDLADDDPAVWVLDRPEAVLQLHHRDVAAGSDAVLTNTFGANRDWLRRFGRQDIAEGVNRRAVDLAREAAGPSRWVLGSIGPTAHGMALRDQADWLLDAGVDALVLETQTSDVRSWAELREGSPIVVSFWQVPPRDVVRSLEDDGVAAIGVNCVPGMAAAARAATTLRGWTDLPVWVKPAASGPNQATDDPASFARAAARLATLGPILVGGCCGSTEAHVAALRAAIATWDAD